ncbi:MAG: hypothetical protein CVU11_10870 [Bacteroidetes bacterium HGW-Bacteroidetes-6]|jgi:hypothetical protein|nr:MAG: hypothetical protein CVU11_10870 [Bacteroidetes bacterium HGW-Bacteroidetes-6]
MHLLPGRFLRNALPMKNFGLLIAVCCMLIGQLAAQSSFRQTLRVDFSRCGNAELDSVAIEKMYFIRKNIISIDSMHMVDNINYGAYKIEVFSENGICLFRRGYSSMFNEWKTSDEAKTGFQYFEESVLIPWYSNMAKIVFSYRDKENVWHVQLTANIDNNAVSKTIIDIPEYPVKDFQIKGEPTQKLDILFIPEGYTGEQMDDFVIDCENTIKYIMQSSPYKEFSNAISFRAVMAPSEESGTDFPQYDSLKNTLVNSTFNTFGTERYLTTFSYHKVMDVASNAPADHVVILVNTEDYGGSGFYNFYTMVAANNMYSDFLILHEMGHSLSGLADEYYTSDVAVQDFYSFEVEPWEPNITTLVDFSTKWDSLVTDTIPIPTPARIIYRKLTGAFEGGGYSATGIYRPAYNCTMKSVVYDGFCEACKAAIRRTILWYSK